MRLTLTLLSLVIFNTLSMNAQERQVTSRLEVYDFDKGTREIVYEAKDHFEAPNWSPDGKFLLFNQEGLLYKFYLEEKRVEPVNTAFANACNNDHGISFDGHSIVISNNDPEGSRIYTLPIVGGTPQLVTEQSPSYWHGWSPDGQTLTYCANRNGNYDVYTIDVNGGEENRLTATPGLDDGPEYSPDGRYIYFNSVRSGMMQIWRMKADGSNQERLTNDNINNWFAHVSPNGEKVVFISYIDEIDPGSHPAFKQVMLRTMDPDGKNVTKLFELFGGQGTINVPSWSPDSRKFAFVSYELN